jgi:hypothetical protein
MRESPRADHGAVEVEPWVDATASWRDGDRLVQSPPCARDQAIAWAYRVPAAWRLIRRSATDDWAELPQP